MRRRRRRRRRNTSVYIDTSGSGGRGWVIHLLHLLVEEGAKVANVNTNSPIISEGGGGTNLNIMPKCPVRDRPKVQSVPYVTVPYVTDLREGSKIKGPWGWRTIWTYQKKVSWPNKMP